VRQVGGRKFGEKGKITKRTILTPYCNVQDQSGIWEIARVLLIGERHSPAGPELGGPSMVNIVNVVERVMSYATPNPAGHMHKRLSVFWDDRDGSGGYRGG
jgi:hypothetical protein